MNDAALKKREFEEECVVETEPTPFLFTAKVMWFCDKCMEDIDPGVQYVVHYDDKSDKHGPTRYHVGCANVALVFQCLENEISYRP